MPTYPAEFALGQPVTIDIEGTTYRGTITRAYWDAAAQGWLYQVSGLPHCEISANEIHPA
jgi:hypothetical protein